MPACHCIMVLARSPKNEHISKTQRLLRETTATNSASLTGSSHWCRYIIRHDTPPPPDPPTIVCVRVQKLLVQANPLCHHGSIFIRFIRRNPSSRYHSFPRERIEKTDRPTKSSPPAQQQQQQQQQKQHQQHQATSTK
jgi:hypothetical protein